MTFDTKTNIFFGGIVFLLLLGMVVMSLTGCSHNLQPIPDINDTAHCDHISAEDYVNCLHQYEPLQPGDGLRCINEADAMFQNCKDPSARSIFSNDAVIR